MTVAGFAVGLEGAEMTTDWLAAAVWLIASVTRIETVADPVKVFTETNWTLLPTTVQVPTLFWASEEPQLPPSSIHTLNEVDAVITGEMVITWAVKPLAEFWLMVGAAGA